MIRLKRFVRPDVIFSAIGHVGVLLLSLLVFGAGAERRAPPEAMTVEIVRPDEAPPFETPQSETRHVDGTPLESKSSGSEVSSASAKGSASTDRPERKATAPPSPELTRTASLATQPPAASPEEPETQPQASEPILRPTIQADQSEPRPEEARTPPDVGKMFALPLALPGGRLGGGFDAPSAELAADKVEFGTTRIRRWFDRNWVMSH